MQVRVIFLISIVSVSACSPKILPEHFNAEALSEVGKLSAISKISSNRKTAYFQIVNNQESDMFCSEVLIGSVADNPNTYLEIGEKQIVRSNVFVRKRNSVEFSMAVNALYSSKAHWRSAKISLSDSECRRANFMEYCSAADHSKEEQAHLLELFTNFRSDSCESLYATLKHKRKINLSRYETVTTRPLIYLGNLRVLTLPVRLRSTPIEYGFVDQSRSAFLEIRY